MRNLATAFAFAITCVLLAHSTPARAELSACSSSKNWCEGCGGTYKGGDTTLFVDQSRCPERQFSCEGCSNGDYSSNCVLLGGGCRPGVKPEEEEPLMYD